MADTRTSLPNHQQNAGPNVVIRDFSGIESNVDPHDLTIGKSVHQLNVGSGPRGELRVRLGAIPLRFDS